MNKSHAFLLLQIIKNKLSIDELLLIGLDYSQIANLLAELFEEELVVDIENTGIVLTQKGENFIIQESKHNVDKSQWIIPLDSERIEKIGVNEIYLPRKKK